MKIVTKPFDKAKAGDIVQSRLLLKGLSTVEHLNLIDHRYGPMKEHLWGTPLCKINGKGARLAIPASDGGRLCYRCQPFGGSGIY